jgi:hypothetical protein
MGFPSAKPRAKPNGGAGFFAVGKPSENGLDYFAELFCRMGILEKCCRVSIYFWSLSGYEIAKIRGKNGIIKVSFKNFFPWLTARYNAHGSPPLGFVIQNQGII